MGSSDLNSSQAESTKHNWVMANQRMAAALKDKGYHYRFTQAKGAKHCDDGARKATLPDAMRWLWRGYPQQ